MRIFAHKQHQTQPPASLNLTPRWKAAPRAIREARPTPPSEASTYDFSRIAIHAKAPMRVRAKLTSTEGDPYEQEADRIAHQVTHMPKPQEKAQEQLQVRRLQSDDLGGIAAAPIVHEVLQSPGQPLDIFTRDFMESRFGHDFSRIRVHTDTRAAQAASAICARAFTADSRDIVFGAGEYAPQTEAGMEILAHELTHTLQGGNGQVQRKTDKQPDETFTYIVQKGDTLWTLAEKFGTAVATIKELNGISQDTNTIKTGQKLRLPKSNKEVGSLFVEIPSLELPYDKLIEDNIDTKLAILDNEMAALADFKDIITSPSKAETIPKGAGELALEKVTQFVFDTVVDASLKEYPGASAVVGLSKQVLHSIEDEQARIKTATGSYNLGQFIVQHRKSLATLHAKLLSSKANIVNEKVKEYASRDKTGKQVAMDYEEMVNYYDTTALGTTHSVEGLLKYVSGEWISAGFSQSKLEFTGGYLTVNVDENWNVTRAYIHAPGGARLAEALLKDGNGVVSLRDFSIAMTLVYKGIYYLDLGEDGSVRGRRSLLGNDKVFEWFYHTYQQKGKPKKTTVLTGD